MTTTEELIPTKPWQDRPLAELTGAKIPTRQREYLVNVGIDTLGKLKAALDDGRDIGLADRAETIRGALDDMAGDEEDGQVLADSQALHVPKGAGGDGAATETIGASVNRIIDALPGTNGVHALPSGEKIQAGQLPPFHEARLKIIAANQECNRAEEVFLVANERAKEAKKKFETAKSNLREVVTWSETPIAPEKPNLFSGVSDASKEGDRSPTSAVDAGNGISKEVEDCWRAFPLSRFDQFGVNASLAEALGGQGIATVGQLSDYTKPNASGFTQRLCDLKGVGPAKVQKIEDGLIAFWAWWPANRDAFAREMGLLENGDAPAAGTGNESAGYGDKDPASEPAADAKLFPEDAAPNPEAHQPGAKRGRKKK